MFDGLFQPMHLIVILFIALLVFGPKKLPELGKGLGDGIRSFKDSMRGNEEAIAKTDDAPVATIGENNAISRQHS
jgi:sec-independent protein translocase protein TatA